MTDALIEQLLAEQRRMAERLDRIEAKLDRQSTGTQSIDRADMGSAGAEPDRTSKLSEIRQSAADMGVPVFEDTVSETDAARLLGRSPFTVRNRRLIDQPIPFEKVGRSIRYRLDVLAEHLGKGT